MNRRELATLRLEQLALPAVIEQKSPPMRPLPSPGVRVADRRCAILGAILCLCGASLFLVAVILNSTYWAANGRTHLEAGLLMACGVVIETVNFVGPSAIAALRGLRRLIAVPVYLVMLSMVVLAATGFVSLNVGDTVASRSSAIENARDANAQRTHRIEIAQSTVDAVKASRDAECASGRGQNCRELEGDLANALHDLATANAMPLAQGPEIGVADPLTNAATQFGVPASIVNVMRLGGLVFVLSAASGLLFWWGRALLFV